MPDTNGRLGEGTPAIAAIVYATWLSASLASVQLSAGEKPVPGMVLDRFDVWGGLALFAAIIGAVLFRWPDLGMRPADARALRLVALPIAYFGLPTLIAIAAGLGMTPPPAIAVVNILLGACAWELMHRGLALSVLRARLPLWSAIGWVALLDGAASAAASLLVASPAMSVITGLANMMMAVTLSALRLRSASLLPGIAVQFFFLLLTLAMASGDAPDSGTSDAASQGLVTLFFCLPFVYYGRFLLRGFDTRTGAKP